MALLIEIAFSEGIIKVNRMLYSMYVPRHLQGKSFQVYTSRIGGLKMLKVHKRASFNRPTTYCFESEDILLNIHTCIEHTNCWIPKDVNTLYLL